MLGGTQLMNSTDQKVLGVRWEVGSDYISYFNEVKVLFDCL